MSGGHFYGCDPYQVGEEYCGQWADEEIDALFFDLFGGGYDGWRSPYSGRPHKCEFGRLWAKEYTGGLAEALDLYLSCDIGEEEYREQVERFKRKWLVKKTPANRVEFYEKRFREYADEIAERLAAELSGRVMDE